MKRMASVVVAVLVCSGVILAAEAVTKEKVMERVKITAEALTKNAPGTIAKIIAGEHPYKDKDNAAFYVFVYNEKVEIVAHPKKKLVGKSYKGKPDVRGKKFRDEIVAGALANTTGWVDYSYKKPGEKGIHAKTTYYQLVTGSDGTKYVVCAGKYK
jgi:signal transduction histidine kinase